MVGNQTYRNKGRKKNKYTKNKRKRHGVLIWRSRKEKSVGIERLER